MKHLFYYSVLLSTLFLNFIANPIYAGTQNIKEIPGGGNRWSPKTYATPDVTDIFNNVVSVLIGIITITAALYFMFQIFLSGYDWISASGEPNKVASARNKMTYAIMGLAIVVAAYAIVGLIANVLGIMVFNPLLNKNIFP